MQLSTVCVCLHSILSDKLLFQIADFGMSRDLADETYYISSGGQIPVKWTAPEVKYNTTIMAVVSVHLLCHNPGSAL